jgi:hypothetical protein
MAKLSSDDKARRIRKKLKVASGVLVFLLFSGDEGNEKDLSAAGLLESQTDVLESARSLSWLTGPARKCADVRVLLLAVTPRRHHRRRPR